MNKVYSFLILKQMVYMINKGI